MIRDENVQLKAFILAEPAVSPLVGLSAGGRVVGDGSPAAGWGAAPSAVVPGAEGALVILRNPIGSADQTVRH